MMKASFHFTKEAKNIIGLFIGGAQGTTGRKVSPRRPPKSLSVTVSKRRDGYHLGAAPIASNPASKAQTQHRARWTECDCHYKALSEAQRLQLRLCATRHAQRAGASNAGPYAYFMQLCMNGEEYRCPEAFTLTFYDDFEDQRYNDRDNTKAPPGVTYPEWYVMGGAWSAATRQLRSTQYEMSGIAAGNDILPWYAQIDVKMTIKEGTEEETKAGLQFISGDGKSLVLVLFYTPEHEGVRLELWDEGGAHILTSAETSITDAMHTYTAWQRTTGLWWILKDNNKIAECLDPELTTTEDIILLSQADNKITIDNIHMA